MSLRVLCTPFVVAAVWLGTAGAVPAEEPSQRESGEQSLPEVAARAIDLANEGQVESAIEVLKEHLANHPSDVPTRVLLGKVLDFNGDAEEAAAVLRKGIAGKPSDFQLWLAIGRLRHRQARDGATVTRTPQGIVYSPSKDKKREAEYRQERYEMAAEAFEKALAIEPGENEVVARLADVHMATKDYDAAVTLLKKQVEDDPNEAYFVLKLAEALEGAGQKEQSIEAFQKALKLDPRSARAHRAMSQHYREAGDDEKANESRRRSEFYEWLPPFATIDYSDESYKTLSAIRSPGDPEGRSPTPGEREKLVQQLIDDGSQESLELLAVLCYYHYDHGPLENKAFDAIASHREQGIPILVGMLKTTQCMCTARQCFSCLARLKAPRAFEMIVPSLAGDNRPVFHLDAAGALETLGDPRAVPHLVKVLNPSLRQDISDDLPKLSVFNIEGGRRMNRIRSALALGAFDTDASKKALREGLANPQISMACNAALYRLTKRDEYLKTIRKAFETGPPDEVYDIARYLIRTGDDDAKKLGQDWLDRQSKQREEKTSERSE